MYLLYVFDVRQGRHISCLFRHSSYLPASNENSRVNNMMLNVERADITNTGSGPGDFV